MLFASTAGHGLGKSWSGTSVEGQSQILAKLQRLSSRAGANALRRALRKGANVVRDAARQNAKQIDDPETAAVIHKNIAVQAGGRRREREVGGPMMRVGIRGGARPLPKGTQTGLSGGNTTHWRFVEFGTSRSKAQPFMRTAAASSVSSVADVVSTAAEVELDKELAKDLK